MPSKSRHTKVMMSTSVSPDVLEWVTAQALDAGVSRSALVNRMLQSLMVRQLEREQRTKENRRLRQLAGDRLPAPAQVQHVAAFVKTAQRGRIELGFGVCSCGEWETARSLTRAQALMRTNTHVRHNTPKS